MNHITGFVRTLPNGRMTAEITDKRGGIAAFEGITPEQAQEIADELTTIATRISEQADMAKMRRAS